MQRLEGWKKHYTSQFYYSKGLTNAAKILYNNSVLFIIYMRYRKQWPKNSSVAFALKISVQNMALVAADQLRTKFIKFVRKLSR